MYRRYTCHLLVALSALILCSCNQMKYSGTSSPNSLTAAGARSDKANFSRVRTLNSTDTVSVFGISGQPVSPASNQAFTGGTIHVAAVANSTPSGSPIGGWVVYIDDQQAYVAHNASQLVTDIAVSTGAHKVSILAWNSISGNAPGIYTAWNVQVSVTTSGGNPSPKVNPSGLPTPPSYAAKIYGVDNITWGWSMATGPVSGCPGGGNCNAPYANMAAIQFVGTPGAADGSTVYQGDRGAALFQVYQGPGWADSLWGKDLGYADGASYTRSAFMWDFWVYLDTVDIKNLEFDLYQVVNGQRFMMGSQCNYTSGIWQGWDEASQKWINLPAPCPKWPPYTWHHVVMVNHRTGSSYTYDNLQIDGVNHWLGTTGYPAETSWATGYGVHIQIDQAGSGAPVREWIENMNLFAW